MIAKTLLLLALFLLLTGAFLAYGPPSSGVGLFLMLCSLPPLFLGIFFYLLNTSEPQDSP